MWTNLRTRLAREQRLLAMFMLIAGFVWAFVKLAGEMVEGETLGVDRAITLLFRQPGNPAVPIGPGWLRDGMIDLTALGSVAVLTLVSVMAVLALLVRRRWRLALMMAAATGGGAIASTVLKGLFARPRPEIVPHLVEVNTLSFPSGHATNSAIVYLTIALVLARNFQDRATRVFILVSAVALVMAIGLTRVFLGVHYPTDVLAGWLVGAAWALAMGAITARLQVRNKVEPPEAKLSLTETPAPTG